MITDYHFKELVIPALQDSLNRCSPPATKIVYHESSSIANNTINDLLYYMKENEIPADAVIISDENNNPIFEWKTTEPTTPEEKQKNKEKMFNSWVAFQTVYKVLIYNGYKRVGVATNLLNEFDNTTVYNMFVNKEFDRLQKYYSLYFDKE